MTHYHKWIKEMEWNDKDRCNRKQHFTSYKCTDPTCSIVKVILEETTTFTYEIDTESE